MESFRIFEIPASKSIQRQSYDLTHMTHPKLRGKLQDGRHQKTQLFKMKKKRRKKNRVGT